METQVGTRLWPILVALATLQGCDLATSRGDLSVSWSIGLDVPSVTECEAASIESVLLILDGERHDFEESVSCASGERTLRDIPSERYAVAVQGLDSEGCPVYEGVVDGVFPDSGTDPAGVSIVMERVVPSGNLDLEWAFDDGRLCGGHGVDDVDLLVLSDDVTVVSETLPCDQGGYEILDIPAGSIDVRITATGTEQSFCWVDTDLVLQPCSDLSVAAFLDTCG